MNALEFVLRTPLFSLLARPWFDRRVLGFITGTLAPCSRLWASAEATDFDTDRFLAANPGLAGRMSRDRAQSTLAALKPLFEAMRETEARARAETRAEATASAIAGAERARAKAAGEYLMARFKFYRAAKSLPAIAFTIADDAAVEAAFGRFRQTPDDAFVLPDLPTVRQSPSYPLAGSVGRSLGFAFGDDEVFAQVYEPAGVQNPPTYIHCHGLMIDGGQGATGMDEVTALVGRGIRVVRAILPEHGRRRPVGWYSGERILARAPLGAMELMVRVAREMATLIAWSRATSTGPVAIGGISLGALTTQFAAARAALWPEGLRPDALFLATTAKHLDRVAFDSEMTQRLGLDAALRDGGWTAEKLARWHDFTNVSRAPVLEPDRIIMLLGDADQVTPFDDGMALAREWRVPAENLFVWPRHGHFSVPLGLIPHDAPYARLAALLKRLNRAPAGL